MAPKYNWAAAALAVNPDSISGGRFADELSVYVPSAVGLSADYQRRAALTELMVAVQSGGPAEDTYYVGKHGDDANSGRTIGAAFLTFGAAAAAAPDGATIACLDGGTYTEDVVIEGPNLLAPNANFVGTGADGTIALQLDKGSTINWFVIGTVKQVGNQTSRNYAVRLHGGDYQSLHITQLHLTGENLTGVLGLANGKVVIGELEMITAAGGNVMIGLDPRAPIDIEIGRITLTGITSGGEAWAIFANHGSTILTGHIGVYQDSLFAGQLGGLLRHSQLFVNLNIDYATSGGTTADIFLIDGGNCNIKAGFLSASTGDVYHLSSNQLRIFAMFSQGPHTHSGGALVARTLDADHVTTFADTEFPQCGGVLKAITGGTTTVTEFAGGVPGQKFELLFAHALTITYDINKIILDNSVDFVGAVGDTMTFVKFNSGVWQETARTVV